MNQEIVQTFSNQISNVAAAAYEEAKSKNFLILITDLLVRLSILLVFIIIGWIVFKFLTTSHPQLFGIGHSENLEEFMVGYLKTICGDMTFFAKLSIDEMITGLSQEQQLQLPLSEIKSIQYACVDFLKEFKSVNNKDLTTVYSFKQKDIPELYLMFMFYDAIKKRKDQKVALMTIFFDKFPIIEKYFVPGSKTTIKPLSDDHPLVKGVNSFDKVREKLAACRKKIVQLKTPLLESLTFNPNSLLSRILVFEMYCELYLKGDTENVINDHILRMYDMRKSGGVMNFTIFEIYMQDYVNFIFKEKIKENIWKTFKKEFGDMSKKIQDAIADKRVSDFILNIPYKIVGIENFNMSNIIHSPPHAKPGDNTEHFINLLFQIAKVFVAMLKIIVAIVKVIELLSSDPMIIFKFIIGWVVGVTIYILYMLVLILNFIISNVLTAIVLCAVKVSLTIVWTSIFLIIAFIYLILLMLDTVTKGMVFKFLRCENLPNAWHLLPNIAYDNKYERTILCSYPCSSRYIPKYAVCAKLPDYQPSFCPQQIIYNAYEKRYNEIENNRHLVKYKPTPDYYLRLDEYEKKDLWSEVYNAKIDYNDKCKENMRQYAHITKQMCFAFEKDEDFKKKDPTLHAKIMDVCRAHCDSDNTKYDNGNPKPNFCSLGPLEDTPVPERSKSRYDLLTRIIFYVIAVALLAFTFFGVFSIIRRRGVSTSNSA